MSAEWELKEGWFTVVVLLLLLLCVAWSIQIVGWTPGLYILAEVVAVAGALGMVLAKSSLPGYMAHALSALAGFTWAAWLTSRVIAVSTSLPSEAAIVELEWRLRMGVWGWVSGIHGTVENVYLLVLGMLMWLMAYFAAWAVFRWQRVWLGVSACAVAILFNYSASSQDLTFFVLVFLLLALLVIVRTSFSLYQQEWRLKGVQFAPDLAIGFVSAGLVFSILAISLSWLVPKAVASGAVQDAWRRITEPWHRFEERWAEAFPDIRANTEPQVFVLSDRMTFGGPVVLSDRPVLDIRAAGGRYWRNRTYDAYLGNGWDNTDEETVMCEPGAPCGPAAPLFDLRAIMTQTVTLRRNLPLGATLTAAGDPLRVSIAVQATGRPPADSLAGPEATAGPTASPEAGAVGPEATAASTAEPTARPELPAPRLGPGGPSLLRPRELLAEGQTYDVTSSRSVANREALSQAGTDYPPWIAPRYVKLPDSVPERVTSLALELTAGSQTPFDKAVAIERFLRGLPYNEQIPGPKMGQDGVDYFLFEQREGYCTYYASAMVVLLRAAGVPARYVEGYFQDKSESGVFHILEKDAHAWPEVFFPGFGWVEFEPTGSRRLNSWSVVRTESPQMAPQDRRRLLDDYEEDLEALRSSGRGGAVGPSQALPVSRRVAWWTWAVAGAVALLLAALWALNQRRRQRIAGLSIAERVYEDMATWVRRLAGVEPLAHQTPYEYANEACGAVPAGGAGIRRIAGLYVEERFGGKAVAAEEVTAAWAEVWPLLWRRYAQRCVERLRLVGRRIAHFLGYWSGEVA